MHLYFIFDAFNNDFKNASKIPYFNIFYRNDTNKIHHPENPLNQSEHWKGQYVNVMDDYQKLLEQLSFGEESKELAVIPFKSFKKAKSGVDKVS